MDKVENLSVKYWKFSVLFHNCQGHLLDTYWVLQLYYTVSESSIMKAVRM